MMDGGEYAYAKERIIGELKEPPSTVPGGEHD